MKLEVNPRRAVQTPMARPLWIFSWLFVLLSLPGCELVKGIFKAGVWTGVLGIAVLVGIAFWVLGKMRK